MEKMKDTNTLKVTTFSQCRIAGYTELTPTGRKLYERKCRELMELGLLKKSYLHNLLTWADTYATYWRLKSEVEVEGYTFCTHNKFGDPVISANPKVKMMNDALKLANNIGGDFGMTPKSSKRVKSEAENITIDPADSWLN